MVDFDVYILKSKKSLFYMCVFEKKQIKMD